MFKVEIIRITFKFIIVWNKKKNSKFLSQNFLLNLKFSLEFALFFPIFFPTKIVNLKKFEMKKHVCWGGGEG